MLGLGTKTLSRYIALGKVPAPKVVKSGGSTLHLWSEADIERVRKLLPKIKNGRKTRFQKERERKQEEEKERQKKKA